MRSRNARRRTQRRPSIECLEQRYVMSADPLGGLLGGVLEQPGSPPNEPPALVHHAQADFWLDPLAERDVDAQLGEIQQLLAGADDLTGLTQVRNDYGFLGTGQTVAVIDSGIAWDHTALGGGLGANYRVVGGWDFAENDANPYDDGPAGSHGTLVTGVVGLDRPGTIDDGVAPGVDLVGLRVFDDAGNSYFSWVESALQWVHTNRNTFANPITAVNISLGTDWNSNTVPAWSTLENEFTQLKADGIFVSVAAGNGFTTYNAAGLSYPAASPSVVPVMSVDDDGSFTYYSQRHTRAIAAPGRSIVSTIPDYAGNQNGLADDFASYSGTDMAAPYVAGASVLIREAMGLAGYTVITQRTIYDHMLATADTIFDPATEQNYHRLNFAAAIDALIPEDDYGSTVDAAHDLGAVGSSTQFAGLVGGSDDADFFSFTAATTGTALLTTTTSHYLDPIWTVADGDDQLIAENVGNLTVFAVIAGRRYTLGLTSRAGIGRFDGTISVSPLPIGDYNHDGVASAADYTVWRNTLGSTDDPRADGDRSGIVDDTDFELWGVAFRSTTLFAFPGDFNRDGIVYAADYTMWRNTLGSTTDLRADANLDGIVDQADYEVWKAALSTSTIGTIPGDFNRDRVVSAADYTVWRNTLGSITDLRADANHDGIVDQADFGVWKTSFSPGQSPPSSASTAPEPPGVVLLLAMLLPISLTRRDNR